MIRPNPKAWRAASPLRLAVALAALAAANGVVSYTVRAAPADEIEGTWRGALALPGGQSLTLVVHVRRGEDGALAATVDSPDQGVRGIPVDRIVFEDGRLRLELPGIAAHYEGRLEEPDRLVGTWHQGGGSLPLELRRADEAEAEGPRRPQEPRPPFPYRVEELRYPNPEAGIRLAGTLTVPEGEGPFPAVALITGSGPQDRDETLLGHKPFLVLADHLTRHGIAVLRSDDRGVGESEGDFAAATSEDFAGDAVAAVALLRGRPEVDRRAVGLVGHSEGGLIAAMVAARRGGVDFIALLAGPGLPGEEILYLQGAAIARAGGTPAASVERNLAAQRRLFGIIREEADPERRRARLESELRATLAELPEAERAAMGITEQTEDAIVGAQLAAVDGPWFRYFLTHDPREDLRRVRVPVLALIGEKDLQVPPAENLAEIRAALAEAGNDDVTAIELPGLNHLFQTAGTGAPDEYARIEETIAPAALETISDWILRVANRRR